MIINSVFEYSESYTHRGWKFIDYKVNFIKLHYCIKGSARYIDENNDVSYQPNHIYFLPVDTTHTLYDKPEDQLYHFYLHFTTTFPLKQLIDIDCGKDVFATDMINILRKYVKSAQHNNIISYATESLFSYALSLQNNDSILPNKLKQKIDNSFLNYDIHEIIKSFNYSQNYLIRLFQKHHGISPSAYYKNKRFEYAIISLQNGKSISEVVEILNYSSAENFSRDFKKKYGISPKKYIKSLQTSILPQQKELSKKKSPQK